MGNFNLPLLRKAVEWAESEARKPIEESEWCQQIFAMPGAQLGRDCGTAYCIAGYVGAYSGYLYDNEDADEYDGLAQKLLGITFEEAWSTDSDFGLFVADNTIEDVRRIAERIAKNHHEEL